jgi:uncharacterized membrane protein YgcG
METRVKWKYVVLVVASLIMSVPLVAAATFFDNFSLTQTLQRLFQWLYSVFQNDYIAFGVLSIMIFLLLFAIFKAALSKVKVFQGQEKQAQTVALSFSMICTFGLFWYAARSGGIRGILSRYFSIFGLFGAIMIGLVVYLIIYFGLGHDSSSRWKWGLIGAGIALLFGGALTNNDGMTSLGVLLLLIGLIAMLFGNGKGGDGGGGGGDGGRGGGSGDGGKRPGGKDGSDDEESPEDKRKRLFDPATDPISYVRFRVRDEHGTGIEGAEIKLRLKHNYIKWRSKNFISTEGGHCPSEDSDPLGIPAGSMEVKVVKKDYAFQLAQFNRRSVAIREHLIFPENTKENWHFIEFVLRRREDVGFKSHILTPVHDRGEYYEISGIVR